MSKVLYLIVLLALSFTFCKNALHMFQQNHYELNRYSKWIFDKKNLSFNIKIIGFCLLLIIIEVVFDGLANILLSILVGILMAIYLIYEESKKEYIKELVVTARVKRQIVVITILLTVIYYLLSLIIPLTIIEILVFVISYLIVYPLALLTSPIEEAVKKHYENDAKKILDENSNLIKVGITGSFGKTSTKNIISDIIGESFYTLITPASYNTPMGITRTIRENLKRIHEVFICEMGADKVNDISYLMDFVRPKYGIVTSIGPQHLATFKTIDNIINEKMKEIEMLPKDGVGIINCDVDYINDYKIKNTCKIIKVGIKNKEADYFGSNIKYSKDGTSFSVKINNKSYKFETCLLGEHNVTNILIGIALAIELGVPVKKVVENVKKVKQVEHRMQVKKINEYTFIDDAFNSNPVGSKMSVDVLSRMDGKRVIVTPGLIDLGNKQDQYNYEFGAYMVNKVDQVILVGVNQTKPIYNGLVENGFKESKIYVCSSVKEAFSYVYKNFTKKDTILLENDLPDAFSK